MREDRGVGEEHIRCGRRAGTAAGSMLAPPEGVRHRDAFPHDAGRVHTVVPVHLFNFLPSLATPPNAPRKS
jgi:hypothetical protein